MTKGYVLSSENPSLTNTGYEKRKKEFPPLPEEEEKIAKAIVDSAYAVHAALGPGLFESIYETCFCFELRQRNMPFRRQEAVPIRYGGYVFEEGLRLDVLVGDGVICELKSVETMRPVFTAQVLSYMKLTQKRLGFLIKFNVPVIKYGIRRIIL